MRKSAPLLITGLSIAGVALTSVLSAKAGAKAYKAISAREAEIGRELDSSEKFKLAWKFYVLPGSVAAITAAGSASQYVFNKKAIASMALACGGIKSSYDRYVDNNRRYNGEDADIRARIGTDAEVAGKVRVFTDEFGGTTTLDFDATEEPRTFYDSWSGVTFQSTMNQVLSAQQLLNRELVTSGWVSAKTWYELLGIDIPERCKGTKYVWEVDDTYVWIDFNNTSVTLDDGFECCIIEFAVEPHPDTANLYF